MTKTKLTGAESFSCSIGELMDLEFADEDFIIQDILPCHGRAMLFGDTGAAKTQLALTLAINVIRGEPFLDKYTTKRGKVVYIAVGDMPAAELKSKVQRLRQELNAEEKEAIKLVYLPDSIDIIEEVKRSKSWLRDEITDFNQVLIIVDIVSQTHTGDENKPGIAGPVYNSWRKLCNCPTGPGILFIHHEKKPPLDMTGYDRKYAFSGHLQWISLTSTAMCIIQKKNSEEREFQVVKPRNMRKPPPIALELDEQTLLCYPLSGHPTKHWVQRQMRNNMPKEAIIVGAQDMQKWPKGIPARSTLYGWLEGYEK